MSDSDGLFMTVGLSGAAGLMFGVGMAMAFGPDSESKMKRDIDNYMAANPGSGGKRRRTRRVKRRM
jgi:hypothetical protein